MLDTRHKNSYINSMNELPLKTRAMILNLLCEGSSMRAIARLTGVSFNTVSKLLIDAGKVCASFHDQNVRNVKAERIQCDEIWSFTYAKQKNVKTAKAAPEGAGDTWTWTAIDADSKLIVSCLVGGRDADYASAFMQDVGERLANRVQLTTDGHKSYLEAVESDPDEKHVSTSYAERQNLTTRMHTRRFTRLTNAFSKKFENHVHMVSLYTVFYNYCRIHKTLRVTPAMAAGVSDTVRDLEWIAEMVEASAPKPGRPKTCKKKDISN